MFLFAQYSSARKIYTADDGLHSGWIFIKQVRKEPAMSIIGLHLHPQLLLTLMSRKAFESRGYGCGWETEKEREREGERERERKKGREREGARKRDRERERERENAPFPPSSSIISI